MSDLQKVKVALTPRNVSRLRNGHVVQLKPDQFGAGAAYTHTIHLNKPFVKKLTQAKSANKGIKLQMTEHEISASGLKLKDIGNALKKGFEIYKKEIKPTVAPLIRKGLTAAVKTALPAAAIALGQPELAAPAAAFADKYAEQGINKIGDLTGAYGVGKSVRKGGRLPAPHPSRNPPLPMPDHSNSKAIKAGIRGGSFKPA